jgi:hypothetical protein
MTHYLKVAAIALVAVAIAARIPLVAGLVFGAK